MMTRFVSFVTSGYKKRKSPYCTIPKAIFARFQMGELVVDI